MKERLKKQLEFIIEVDKIKQIFRKTKLFDQSRYENDAEHSWHLCLMALVLSEYANFEVDMLKVLKMIIVHDIVEIDAGDYIIYTDQVDEKNMKEEAAAKRIFGILPEEIGSELKELWIEFEKRESNEAKFAAAVDRLEPLLQNFQSDGFTWKENNISGKKILSVNERISLGSEKLWDYAKGMIEGFIEKGIIEN
ncbi:MAG: HD domain-containing protein [Clostridia bacterium]|nr:HD domain-containing protein [Clostridia bacterium]